MYMWNYKCYNKSLMTNKSRNALYLIYNKMELGFAIHFVDRGMRGLQKNCEFLESHWWKVRVRTSGISVGSGIAFLVECVFITPSTHVTHRCNITVLWWVHDFIPSGVISVVSYLVGMLICGWFNFWLNSEDPLRIYGLLWIMKQLLIAFAYVPITCLNFISRSVDDPVVVGYLFLWLAVNLFV